MKLALSAIKCIKKKCITTTFNKEPIGLCKKIFKKLTRTNTTIIKLKIDDNNKIKKN